MHGGLHWPFGILAWYLSDKKWPYSFKQHEELLPLQYTIPYHPSEVFDILALYKSDYYYYYYPISSTGHEPLYSNTVSQVKMLQIILQLGLWAAADSVEHHLSFATLTLFSRSKTPVFVAGCTVTLVSAEAVC